MPALRGAGTACAAAWSGSARARCSSVPAVLGSGLAGRRGRQLRPRSWLRVRPQLGLGPVQLCRGRARPRRVMLAGVRIAPRACSRRTCPTPGPPRMPRRPYESATHAGQHPRARRVGRPGTLSRVSDTSVGVADLQMQAVRDHPAVCRKADRPQGHFAAQQGVAHAGWHVRSVQVQVLSGPPGHRPVVRGAKHESRCAPC